jgi:hypothetical protein
MFIEVLGHPPPELLSEAKRKDKFYETNGELKGITNRKVGLPGSKQINVPDRLLASFIMD